MNPFMPLAAGGAMTAQEFLRRLQAQQGMPMAAPQAPQGGASIFQPIPVPVPVPVPTPQGRKGGQSRPAANFNPFEFWKQPQADNEPNAAYGIRNAVGAPFRALDAGVRDVGAALREAGETPAGARARQAKAAPAAGGFPNSFRDPAYDAAEANAARLTGVPLELLRRIRLNGERSNNDQVSSAGARSPYQIIPSTAKGIKEKYKIDPFSSPENAALAAAYVLREQAGNPGPQDWTPQLAARAAGGYFGGAAGARNPFGSISDGNTSVGEYTQRVLGGSTALPAPFLNPYDPSYDQAAMGQLANQRAAMMQPFEVSANLGPAPEMPQPVALPRTDFGAADAALEAMRPVEMAEKERITRERDGFFQGIAKAAMSMSGNEGLGTFLMKLGGSALGGRMAARDEIRDIQDKFDEKMARFNAAVYQNEMGKAQTHAREALAEVQQTNEYNLTNWKTQYNQWLSGAKIDISGTSAVVQRLDPMTGQLSVKTLPIPGAVDAAIAQSAAGLFQSMGGRQMAGNQQIASATNAIIARQALSTMSAATSDESDAAATAGVAFYGTYHAQNSNLADLLGEDAAKSLEQTVQKQLMSQGISPGTQAWIERRDRIVAGELTKVGLADPNFQQKMMELGSPARAFRQLEMAEGTRTRTSTNARGQTSVSQTQTGADIFGSDMDDPNSSISRQNLSQYGYSRY